MSNQISEKVPVTVALVFSAVTHERDMTGSGEPGDEAQRELLPVVLDRPAA
jgi:hypothetical protein